MLVSFFPRINDEMSCRLWSFVFKLFGQRVLPKKKSSGRDDISLGIKRIRNGKKKRLQPAKQQDKSLLSTRACYRALCSSIPFLFSIFWLFFLRVTFVLRAPEFLNQMKRPKHLKRKFSCRRETEPYKLTWAIWVAVAALFFPSLGGSSLFLFQSW